MPSAGAAGIQAGCAADLQRLWGASDVQSAQLAAQQRRHQLHQLKLRLAVGQVQNPDLLQLALPPLHTPKQGGAQQLALALSTASR
jgi:hypothetical protein